MKTRLAIMLLAVGALIFSTGCTRTETAFLVGAAIIGTAIAIDYDDHGHHNRHSYHNSRHNNYRNDNYYTGHNNHYSSYQYDSYDYSYCD